jgi:ribosomal protein S27AE
VCLRRRRDRRWRHKTPEKQREYREQRKAYHAEYREKNRERLNAQKRVRAATDAARQKHNARLRVLDAVKSGRLVRQPCETCGAEPTEAHHDDYDKPLEVRWLCSLCHGAEHAAYPVRRAA